MVVVAVAGGLGDFGRVIIDALLSMGKHQVYSLSRKKPGNVKPDENPAGAEYTPVLQTDYKNAAEITALLESQSVHTIISALNLDFEASSDAQIRLIEAAAMSNCVKRFVPSEFNIDYDLGDDVLPYPEKRFHVAARRAVEQTALEYTFFYSGMFMDYLAMPRLKTHMKPFFTVLDLEHNEIAIPGDGTAVMSLTYTKDVARYVAASLDLESWPRVSLIIGSRLTLNELASIAERIKGEKLDVRYDSLESLKAHSTRPLTSNQSIAESFEVGQLNALQCDLGGAIALGAYDIAKADGGVDMVKLYRESLERPVDIESWLARYWSPTQNV